MRGLYEVVLRGARSFVAPDARAASCARRRSAGGGRSATEEAKPTADSLETVKNNLDLKKAILVDVREQDEWDEGHLERARLVPLSKIQKGLKPDALPKDKIVYLHCRSGRRSLIAQELLKKEGYDVRSLQPGYDDLLKAGFKKAE
jgi:rhodanese-related sulfurtransferase